MKFSGKVFAQESEGYLPAICEHTSECVCVWGEGIFVYMFAFTLLTNTSASTCVHMCRCNLYAALQAIKLQRRVPMPISPLHSPLLVHHPQVSYKCKQIFT